MELLHIANRKVRTTPGFVALAITAIAFVGACRPPARARAPAPAPAPVTQGWPRTVAEAVDLKLRTMSDGEKAALRQVSRERVQDAYHGFQMLHRADFGLSEGNEQLLASCGSVRMPAEECMRIILDALWVALQGNVGSRLLAWPAPDAQPRS